MNNELIDALICFAMFFGMFSLSLASISVMYFTLRKIFPNFEMKLFSFFGIGIDEQNNEEDELNSKSHCRIIRMNELKGVKE